MPIRTRGVLIIDNDASIRGAIVRKLVGDGIHADIARTATDAIQMLDEAKYQVVLLDWQLPDGDGSRVVNHLRDAGAGRPERVMVMTSAEPKMLRNVDRSLVKGVLFKPVDLTGVTAHVRALLL
jgi:DNA-binding response OmpR family regulator